jgi:hypothetical protein
MRADVGCVFSLVDDFGVGRHAVFWVLRPALACKSCGKNCLSIGKREQGVLLGVLRSLPRVPRALGNT